YVQFQRGVMWAELADQPERAVPLYEEAVKIVPEFVVANVHLAELELQQGRHADAKARLERMLASGTRDPEPEAKLGQLQDSAGDPAGREHIAHASRRYDELLARYPLAFADHGAEFYAGPGNRPERAVELAQ